MGTGHRTSTRLAPMGLVPARTAPAARRPSADAVVVVGRARLVGGEARALLDAGMGHRGAGAGRGHASDARQEPPGASSLIWAPVSAATRLNRSVLAPASLAASGLAAADMGSGITCSVSARPSLPDRMVTAAFAAGRSGSLSSSRIWRAPSSSAISARVGAGSPTSITVSSVRVSGPCTRLASADSRIIRASLLARNAGGGRRSVVMAPRS